MHCHQCNRCTHRYTKLHDGRRNKNSNVKHIRNAAEVILHSWPSAKAELQKDLQPYQSFRDEIATVDGTAMKSTILPAALDKALKQLHLNHKRIEKTRLLAHTSIHWNNMNADIEERVTNYPTCMDFQATQSNNLKTR